MTTIKKISISEKNYRELLHSQEILNLLKTKIGLKEIELGETFEIESPEDLDVLVKGME